MLMGIQLLAFMTVILIIIFQTSYYCIRGRYTDPVSGIELSARLSKDDFINLRHGQKKMTRMLREFDRICRKYGLRYWCMGGTLIGTLRHKGWVPWDGDLDVAMIDSDYEILYKVAKDELPRDLWLQDKRDDPRHHKIHKKIRDLNSCYIKWVGGNPKYLNGLCLDIFMYKISGNKLVAHDNPNISAHDKVYDVEFIFPLRNARFEDVSVYIPNQYKQYSINSWGHYPPKLPSVNKRYPHEGRIVPFTACSHHKKQYPKLYN